jgi:hypothetical protein
VEGNGGWEDWGDDDFDAVEDDYPDTVTLNPRDGPRALPLSTPARTASTAAARRPRSGGGGGGNGGGPAPLSLWAAWAIPGVAPFALALFFSKLIAYTFLYWLPFYISSTPIQGRLLSPKEAGDLSTLFDVGGIAGGVAAGYLSDRTGASACVAAAFTGASLPALYAYRALGRGGLGVNMALMAAAGFFVNGPYALITTAVSADLGTHESLGGDAKVRGSGAKAGAAREGLRCLLEPH